MVMERVFFDVGWEVFEVVVEGAVGDVVGEGCEGFGGVVSLDVGDGPFGGVPDMLDGVMVGGVGRQVDQPQAFQLAAGLEHVCQGPGMVEGGVVQYDSDLAGLGFAQQAGPGRG